MKTSEVSPEKGRDKPSIEDVKARTSIVVLIRRNVVLEKHGRKPFGLCPFHEEKTPSFTVSEAKGTFHCFGCGAHGDAFDYLRRAQGMELHEALEHLAIEAGMTPDREGRRRPTRQPTAPPAAHNEPQRQINHNGALALEIWRASRDPIGTLTATYLHHRGITCKIPPTIRDHLGLKHAETGQNFPVMVAAITGADRKVTAVHRTFLRCDGRGKANVTEPKMALGPFGAGAVRLGPAGPALGLAEGIETGLSVMQLFDMPVWCSLSNTRLDRLELPSETVEVHLFGDRGGPGVEAVERAVKAYQAQGRRVVVRLPPESYGDWNDALCEEVAA